MKSDHILEDIRHIPRDSQAHFHPAADVVELLSKGVVVDPEDPLHGLRAVGHDAEGDGENRVVGHQPAKYLVVRGQPTPFGADLLVGKIADDRRDLAVADRVDHRAVQTEAIERLGVGCSIDNRIQIAATRRGR